MAIHFIASVKNNHLEEIQSLAKQMEDKGCKITLVAKLLGVISGTVEDEQSLGDLTMDGIDKVEIDRKIGPF
ncbi:MAG TPA: hypothetical protein VKX33_13090 [Cyclobacteriaceae bacterium]|nr:hypothetical protein [Cyclobacteriaceae bacterium]